MTIKGQQQQQPPSHMYICIFVRSIEHDLWNVNIVTVPK